MKTIKSHTHKQLIPKYIQISQIIIINQQTYLLLFQLQEAEKRKKISNRKDREELFLHKSNYFYPFK